MAIKNLKKHLILALLIFNIAFWLYIEPPKKKGWFLENIANAFLIC
jgi:uncharacterized ion transporter superfamily protein YfcC